MTSIDSIDGLNEGAIVVERERCPHYVEQVERGTPLGVQANLRKLYRPETPDSGVVFADWKVSERLHPGFPHCHFGNLNFRTADPNNYRGWKYGSYSDCKVHTI